MWKLKTAKKLRKQREKVLKKEILNLIGGKLNDPNTIRIGEFKHSRSLSNDHKNYLEELGYKITPIPKDDKTLISWK